MQEIYRDIWLFIVASPDTLYISINLPEARDQCMFSHWILNSQVKVFLLFKVYKIQFVLLYFTILLAYRHNTRYWLTWSLLVTLEGEKKWFSNVLFSINYTSILNHIWWFFSAHLKSADQLHAYIYIHKSCVGIITITFLCLPRDPPSFVPFQYM